MSYRSSSVVRIVACPLLAVFLIPFHSLAQSNLAVRVMASNLTSGSGQSYETPGIDILKGLKPDVVAIQEFRYNSSSSTANLRQLVDLAFGTNFNFYCEPGYNIPNGIVSRWPIIGSGSWDDTQVNDRGFAWARLDIPGTNDLYVVSVHLHSSGGATSRATEAGNLKTLIQANFPSNAWVILAGDFNTSSRTEQAVITFKTFLSDNPIPADNNGDQDTNEPRSKPYDYVLPTFSLTNKLVPATFASHTFPNGLVFDSAVYTPLSDVSPVSAGDSHVTGMQHMGVIKDFLIPVLGDSGSTTNAPFITSQPQPQTVSPGSNATFTVIASGTAPLSYQWRFNGNDIQDSTSDTCVITNAQFTNAGNYTVVITNFAGGVTSVVAVLTVSNMPPEITSQPEGQTVFVGDDPAFSVTASGTGTLDYQWRFNGTNIPNANANNYTLTGAQLTNSGDYTVVVANSFGSITSSPAALTVVDTPTGTLVTLAGWDVRGQGSFGLSPLTPSTNAPQLAIVGLTRGPGVLTTQSATTNAWGGHGFDAANAASAASAGDYATCSISANSGYRVSFTAISKFDYRRSGTGPSNGVIQVQIGSGPFTDIAAVTYPAVSTGASLGAIDLSSNPALQNVGAGTNVTFRIVNYGGATGGTWYIYDTAVSTAPDFAIDGIVSLVQANPPASAAVLSSPAIANDQFSFVVTGTSGSNYVVETSTNLVIGTWTPLYTNTSPFTYTQTNSSAFPQRFYRAVYR